jgi:alkylated DNA nucleotide flippase Atl1
VLSSGEVRAGDAVTVDADRFPAMPTRPRERVIEIASRIPTGRVLAYGALVRAAGLARSYVRVMPRFLAAAGSDFPVHRVVAAGGALPVNRVRDQRGLLTAEGIAFSAAGAVPERFWWNAEGYFGDAGEAASA